jgi:hypothetical protein
VSAYTDISVRASAINVSVSLGVGYSQQSGRLDSDINSPLLPGASPFSSGVRR